MDRLKLGITHVCHDVVGVVFHIVGSKYETPDDIDRPAQIDWMNL